MVIIEILSARIGWQKNGDWNAAYFIGKCQDHLKVFGASAPSHFFKIHLNNRKYYVRKK